jgi:hypothetical protein
MFSSSLLTPALLLAQSCIAAPVRMITTSVYEKADLRNVSNAPKEMGRSHKLDQRLEAKPQPPA